MINQILSIVNTVIGTVFMLCYSYQIVFLFISFFTRPRKYPQTDKRCKYAFVICARDEENVISEACESIGRQNYPRELINIYVVADNCTDNTAAVARASGAEVIVRCDPWHIGKGYALEAAFEYIKDTVGLEAYDGYIILDADNLLDEGYVCEMNKCFVCGEEIVTGYRNVKNYGENWLSMGYSVWYLREMRQLNAVRDLLGTTAELRGTGFLVSSRIVAQQGGWRQHLLIEDVEFAARQVLEGKKIAYCHDAIFYDEQPTDFAASWHQRRRWCRGYLQILRRYGARLLGSFIKGGGFSNFDMVMSMCPAFFITVGAAMLNALALIAALIFEPASFLTTLCISLILLFAACLAFALVGLIAVITEWRRIRATTVQKLLSVIVFPIFMATYVPIAAVSIVKSARWIPTRHKSLQERENKTKKI